MLNYMYVFGKQFRKSVIDGLMQCCQHLEDFLFRLQIVQTVSINKNLAILTLVLC